MARGPWNNYKNKLIVIDSHINSWHYYFPGQWTKRTSVNTCSHDRGSIVHGTVLASILDSFSEQPHQII